MNKTKLYTLAETLSEYFLYGFIFFTPVGHAGAAVCFGFLALCFAIRKTIRPDFHFLKKTEHWWLLLFFIFCGLSLINSGPYLQKSLRALFLKWGEYAMVFLFVREMMTDPARRIRVGRVILIVAAIIALDGLFQFFTGTDLFYARQSLQGPSHRALTASFKNPNDLASYLGLVALVALAMAAAATTKKTCGMLWTLTITLGACLLLTFSRGSWIGFAGGLLLMLLVSRRWKVFLSVLILFVAVILLDPLLSERAMPALSSAAGQTTDVSSGRFEIWKMGFQLILENPFLGKGMGTFMDYFGQRVFFMSANYAHNCYLQIWAESGIFSLLAFLLFLGTLLRKGAKTFQRTKDPLLLGLLCGIFAFSIHSFFDTQFYSVAQSFLFWSMLGILAAASQNNAPASKTRSSEAL